MQITQATMIHRSLQHIWCYMLQRTHSLLQELFNAFDQNQTETKQNETKYLPICVNKDLPDFRQLVGEIFP